MDPETIQKILDDLERYPIVSVSAPTGTGKSTRVPAAAGYGGKRIFIGVPTNSAAQNLSAFVAAQNPQLSVGYGSEGERHYTDDTLVVYMTHGHLVNVLLQGFKDGEPKDFPDIDILMIDEVHTGSVDVVLALRLWVIFATKSEIGVPLLVSSATMSGEELSPLAGFRVQSFTLEVQNFAIEIRYLNKGFKIDSPELYKAVTAETYKLYRTTERGHILVFAPGQNEVSDIARQLEKGQFSIFEAKIFAVYGALGTEKIREILAADKNPNQRMILVTTPVMESALTVDNVVGIVDSGMEKIPKMTDSGGVGLETVWESQASARQRAGRTGRTMNGIAVRVYTQKQFEEMPKIRSEEISRVPIFSEVMSLINVGLDPGQVLSMVPKERIEGTVEQLEDQGMIEDGKITIPGRFISKLPLGMMPGAFLYDWISAGLPPFPGICLACIIDNFGPNYFFFPFKGDKDNNDYDSELYQTIEDLKQFGGPDPLESYLNMFLSAMQEFQSLNPPAAPLNAWASRNRLNARKIRELFSITRRVTDIVSRHLKRDIPIGNFTSSNVLREALPHLKSTYSDQVFVIDKGNQRENDRTEGEGVRAQRGGEKVRGGGRDNAFKNKKLGSYVLRGTGAFPDAPPPKEVLGLVLSVIQKADGRTFKNITLYTTLKVADPPKMPEAEAVDLKDYFGF